jgi:hypothetical protein
MKGAFQNILASHDSKAGVEDNEELA